MEFKIPVVRATNANANLRQKTEVVIENTLRFVLRANVKKTEQLKVDYFCNIQYLTFFLV